MLNSYVTRATVLVAALITVAACSDDEPSAPSGAALATVALVELEGTRPAFYIQKSDGSGRTRIHGRGRRGPR